MIALSRIAAVCGLSLLASGLAHAEDWKLAKDEDGIKIYLSEVQGSKYKAYRGVTTINADVATLRTLQEDVKGSCQWIHACAEQSLLKHEGMQSWVYTRFDMPWPVEARDSILHVVSEQGADGSLTRKLDGQPQYLPLDKDTHGSPACRGSGVSCHRVMARSRLPTRCTPSRVAACRPGWPTASWSMRRSIR